MGRKEDSFLGRGVVVVVLVVVVVVVVVVVEGVVAVVVVIVVVEVELLVVVVELVRLSLANSWMTSISPSSPAVVPSVPFSSVTRLCWALPVASHINSSHLTPARLADIASTLDSKPK